MVCVTRITYLFIRPTVFSSRVDRERVQVFGGLVGCFCVLCLVSPPFFVFSVASSITYLFAFRFPYREGVEGAFVFFFPVTYLSYLVYLPCCHPL